ncbi:hypothetical protein [Deinococcus irradiatisoli]|uniref:hypothetical protein n=1 Tax=Deinococcus irradiatisoli TaxID=2202254 RepID=UPI0011B1DB9F|nr:hypothetical protein [Deinococcus irradiatisoli]
MKLQINSGKWSIKNFYGLDAQGNTWISGFDKSNIEHTALLRLSSSGSVLKELPDFLGTFSAIPTGGLWYATHEYEDTRIGYIAP